MNDVQVTVPVLFPWRQIDPKAYFWSIMPAKSVVLILFFAWCGMGYYTVSNFIIVSLVMWNSDNIWQPKRKIIKLVETNETKEGEVVNKSLFERVMWFSIQEEIIGVVGNSDNYNDVNNDDNTVVKGVIILDGIVTKLS